MMRQDQEIRAKIIEYVLASHICPYDATSLPLDESLVELGVMDSYGVVELVDFLERTWSISIADSEITKEAMGSVNKMVKLVTSKIA